MIPIRLTRWCHNFTWGFWITGDEAAGESSVYSLKQYRSVSEMYKSLKEVLNRNPTMTRQCLIDDGEPQMTPLDLNNETECVAFILRYS
jgi:hypothetical protein